MKKIDSHILVIFGASGDLTQRKLIPAIFNLFCRGFLPRHFAVLGCSRTSFSDDDFRNKVVYNNEHLKQKKTTSEEEMKRFADQIYYQPVDSSVSNDFEKLKNRLEALDGSWSTRGRYIFYLSTPPSIYEVIPEQLYKYGLTKENDGSWKRLIIEKPFGNSLSSAKALNLELLRYLKEDQIYRIDHYLGKETVQNLLVTRFANSIFEPLWNRNYVHHVEITSAEDVGVEKRGGYYEHSGALRDIVQNHLLQLLAVVAMEPPVQASAKDIRNEKLKLFQSIRPFSHEDIRENVIRGQYMASKIKGKEVKGYREEHGVNPDSRTETYVAMKLFIDNWRWAGVPFYVRTGKRMPTKVTEVVIHFKSTPHHLFAGSNQMHTNNILVIRIQPNEGILLKFGMKVPGEGFNVSRVNMDFLYEDLANAYIPDAYERLLLDCMQGDPTLYARGDSAEATWAIVDPILEAWKEDKEIKMYGYPAGTWGPENADILIGEGKSWRYPCKNLVDDGLYCEL
jgi:glucose-6-phosphate 1-dehydrogenase